MPGTLKGSGQYKEFESKRGKFTEFITNLSAFYHSLFLFSKFIKWSFDRFISKIFHSKKYNVNLNRESVSFFKTIEKI